MAAIYSTDNRIGVDINSVFILDSGTPEYPAPPFLPGTQANGTDDSTWVYSTASITIGAGNVVLFSQVPGSWSVALVGGATTAGSFGQLAGVVGGSTGTMVVPAPTGTQTGTYFWVQTFGNCPNVATLASTTQNATLHTTATLGGVLSSSGAGTATTYIVNGIVITQATGSAAGPNTAILNNPYTSGTVSGG